MTGRVREADPRRRARRPRPAGPAPLPRLLCYHKVEPRHELGVTRLSPGRFARQMERLAREGWRTLGLGDLTACLAATRRAGPREVVLTFDDAYRGLREYAFPVLEALGFAAICSVITDYAGRLNRWDVAYGGRRFAHLAWRDMRRWQTRGIEFVSHTATHPWLPWLAAPRVRQELARSRAALRAALDVECDVVSYPFGAQGARERALAAAEGYRVGLTLARRWRGDPLAVPRHPVYVWALERPGLGPLGAVERGVAAAANRCAVGTTLMRGRPVPT